MAIPYTFAAQSGPIPLSELDANFAYVLANAGVGSTSTLERQTATAGQTYFTLSNAYVPGSQNLTIFTNGKKDSLTLDYSETDTTHVTYVSPGKSVGDIVEFFVNITSAGFTASSALVSYQPLGGTLTSAQAKLREIVSVLDFGAAPTAPAATNAAAFAAAWAASNPQAVLIPAGTYNFIGAVTGSFYSFGVVTLTAGSVTNINVFTQAVTGPAGAAANNVAVFNGATGTIIKDGGTLGTAAFTAATAYQPADADLTTWAGITPAAGIGTFLGTPTSANLRAALTDETGTGLAVFNNSPALITPTLGDAFATSLSTPGTIAIGGGTANGQYLTVQALSEETTILAGATTTTAILMPAGAIILAVTVRVTTAIPANATSFSVGDAGSATRFGTSATISINVNTTDVGTKAGAYYNASALGILLTMNGGNPTANTGRVRVTIHYISLTPAIS